MEKKGITFIFLGVICAGLDDKPAQAKTIEELIHTQRATHQAVKKKRTATCFPVFDGPKLVPSKSNGLFADVFGGIEINGSLHSKSPRFLKRYKLDTIHFQNIESFSSIAPERKDFSLGFTGFLDIKEEGTYWFGVKSDDGFCLAIDGEVVIDNNRRSAGIQREGRAFLRKGHHRVDLRYYQSGGGANVYLKWIPPGSEVWGPGAEKWELIPFQEWYLPKEF